MLLRRASLRRRLILTVLALLSLGMVGMAVGIFTTVREYVSDQADQQLATVGAALEDRLSGNPAAGLTHGPPAPGDDAALVLRSLAGSGTVPSFVQVRGPDGRVVDTVDLTGEGTASTPRLPERMALPEAVAGDPGAAVFRTVDGETGEDLGGGQRIFGDGERRGPDTEDDDWRIRMSSLPDGHVLVVGMHRTELNALIRQVAGGVLVGTAVALATVTLLALRAIRRGMRPLDEIATTAHAIGAGDLSRRVDPAEPHTEVGRLGMALNAMLGQIESAVREQEASEGRLRRFVADASHELRTPVASIRAYAELFRRGAAHRPGDLVKVMRRIESETERMGLLVDELLLLARLDQGRSLERELVDLADLAADAVADAEVVDPDRPLELVCAGPVMVSGDAAKLRQVLGNLLANVRQHTPPGTPATVRVDAEDGLAVIEVADRGPGLTEEQRDHVFERFYRADPSRSRNHGGAGLGLAIVAAVAAAHGGEATVTSAPGHGATFHIQLPHQRAPALPESAPPRPRTPDGGRSG